MLQSMMWHKSVNSTNVYKKVFALAAGCRVQGAGCRFRYYRHTEKGMRLLIIRKQVL
ncbi:hypothetical protein N1689_09240 [Pantoea sp. XY16]|nr:hypothetical protein [Pantoea sp. XY16]MCT2418022.1 hypothetical protein [Pantoea sp. XY16]